MRYAVALVVLAACAAGADDKEIALGRALASQVRRTSTPLNDRAASACVDRIADRISKGAAIDLSVELLDDRKIAASAFPGGFLFLNSGLIAKAENEAELAGVIAHLTAHIKDRNFVRDTSTAGARVFIMGGWSGLCARWPEAGPRPRSMQAELARFEKQADEHAIAYLESAGYDPSAMLDFFSRLVYEHPELSPTAELVALRNYLDERLAPSPRLLITTSEFEGIRDRMRARSETMRAQAPSLYPRH
jgi:predicted Zn-dependent protease